MDHGAFFKKPIDNLASISFCNHTKLGRVSSPDTRRNSLIYAECSASTSVLRYAEANPLDKLAKLANKLGIVDFEN